MVGLWVVVSACCGMCVSPVVGGGVPKNHGPNSGWKSLWMCDWTDMIPFPDHPAVRCLRQHGCTAGVVRDLSIRLDQTGIRKRFLSTTEKTGGPVQRLGSSLADICQMSAWPDRASPLLPEKVRRLFQQQGCLNFLWSSASAVLQRMWTCGKERRATCHPPCLSPHPIPNRVGLPT